jgi:hypothetical protein
MGSRPTQKIRLKELGTARHMPIVAIRPTRLTTTGEQCFEAGMDGYVVKPVSTKAICDEVEVMALLARRNLRASKRNLGQFRSCIEGLSAAGTANPTFVAFPRLRQIGSS